jgi:hypothetical protein
VLSDCPVTGCELMVGYLNLSSKCNHEGFWVIRLHHVFVIGQLVIHLCDHPTIVACPNGCRQCFNGLVSEMA